MITRRTKKRILFAIVTVAIILALVANLNTNRIAHSISVLESYKPSISSFLESENNKDKNSIDLEKMKQMIQDKLRERQNEKNNHDEDDEDDDKQSRVPKEKVDTGSFANCKESDATSTKKGEIKEFDSHPDAGTATISCRVIQYRAPLSEIEQGGFKVVVGVLSGAGGKGPYHRDSIRSTWAFNRRGVYFIVAGPWEAIEDEYNTYRDLIWLREDEVYEGEKSVLPFKTETFIHIIAKYSLPGEVSFDYLFKTDDDSYVDLLKLEKHLLEPRTEYLHYWGKCTDEHFEPLRDTSFKWHVTYEMYPEQFYPLYCQGAGFAMSYDFVECMTRTRVSTQTSHLASFRYNPFEDVSVGLLAERCGYEPVSEGIYVEQYRNTELEIGMKAKEDVDIIHMLPKVTMKDKILQHRVKTHHDMFAHYLCATTEGC